MSPVFEEVKAALRRLEDAYMKGKRGEVEEPNKDWMPVWIPYQFADLLGIRHHIANAYAKERAHAGDKAIIVTASPDSQRSTRYLKTNHYRHLYVQFKRRNARGKLVGPHWRTLYFLSPDGKIHGQPNPRWKPELETADA